VRIAARQSAKCPAPPSRRSSRSTLVDNRISEPELSNGTREVLRLVFVGRLRLAMRHIAERAAPRAHIAENHESRCALAEHSPMFGQDASSHTVCIRFSAQHAFHFVVAGTATGFTRIHSGLRSRSCSGTILIGLRAVFSFRFALALRRSVYRGTHNMFFT